MQAEPIELVQIDAGAGAAAFLRHHTVGLEHAKPQPKRLGKFVEGAQRANRKEIRYRGTGLRAHSAAGGVFSVA